MIGAPSPQRKPESVNKGFESPDSAFAELRDGSGSIGQNFGKCFLNEKPDSGFSFQSTCDILRKRNFPWDGLRKRNRVGEHEP